MYEPAVGKITVAVNVSDEPFITLVITCVASAVWLKRILLLFGVGSKLVPVNVKSMLFPVVPPVGDTDVRVGTPLTVKVCGLVVRLFPLVTVTLY